jgi:hypothetical protein
VALLVLLVGVLVAPFVMAAGILVLAGTSLLIDAWHCRHPSIELVERLPPFQSLADEAAAWLAGRNSEANE